MRVGASHAGEGRAGNGMSGGMRAQVMQARGALGMGCGMGHELGAQVLLGHYYCVPHSLPPSPFPQVPQP